MKAILLVGAGSCMGGVCRYLLSLAVPVKANGCFPAGTFIVNITGCFLIGLVFGWAQKEGVSNDTRLLLATGVCGGFTTFSAFSLEALTLLRTENTGMAGLYVAASMAIGLLFTYAGLLCAR